MTPGLRPGARVAPGPAERLGQVLVVRRPSVCLPPGVAAAYVFARASRLTVWSSSRTSRAMSAVRRVKVR